MRRLIDANALVEKAYWHGEHPTVDHLFAEGVDAVDVRDIEEAPTIEAEPVRHGRWERTSDGAARCTACKRKMNPSQYGYAFCGLCGAKMDLGGMTNDEG